MSALAGLSKNEYRSCVITDFSDDGEGIGRADGIPVFVSGAVIGDTVKCKITKVKKNMAYARLEEIMEASPDRVLPACTIAKQCGGCRVQQYDYAAQLRYKARKVKELLVRIGHFPEEEIAKVLLPVTGMEEPYRFRNKAQVPVGVSDHRIVCGYYAPHSHRIVPQEDCLTGDAVCAGVLAAVRAWMEEQRIPAYDEDGHTGLVRHVLIRKGFATGEVMVCLVVNQAASTESDYPGLRRLAEELQRVCSGEGSAVDVVSTQADAISTEESNDNRLVSLCINYNPQRTNVILGRHTRTVFGMAYIKDVLCGLRFRISAQSFYQVNPWMTERLYGKVAEHAAKALPDALQRDVRSSCNRAAVIWDLYCGIGTISLMLAKRFPEAKVYGVEIVPQAIEDAKENARINGIENAHFLCAKSEDIHVATNHDAVATTDAESNMLPAPDIIVVDPPRKGLDRALIDTILRAAPAHIIYVSCDPATLSRDLHLFADGGYQLREASPFDMFPHTTHVESVCLMSKV
ncbi:MAG: 23S rRNA (uracil(1939)-C(5))-methyltransferase RlmD [Lachnospiraceae bacterium]|nr:23S rRNA (uracil(1939)-C(5))-methyltransferase RlmD [Lachnospiraceae bacterium]